MTALSPTARAPRATADYVRRARRTRARLGHAPAKMHRALRELASRQQSGRSDPPQPALPSASRGPFPGLCHPVIAEAFAAEVERSINTGTLRYSERQRLLRSARNLGIARFEANLIIATVQHRHVSTRITLKPRENAGGRRWPAWCSAIALVLIIEATIAAAACILAGLWRLA